MSKVYTTTLRLNLGNEVDRRAYEYLRQMDRRCYKSYSAAIVAAINDHFSRRERLADDPFLETRERQEAFLSEVKDAVRDCLQEQQLASAVRRRSCKARRPPHRRPRPCRRKPLTQRWTSSDSFDSTIGSVWY